MDRSADALIGRVLDGRYRVGPKIARGGMATVYEATDLRLDRVVAVKVMHEGLSHDEEFVRRFQREARSAARLSHHNVVAVFDTGDDAGTLFLVMEYVPGLTMRDLIRKEAPLSPAKALATIEPVISALAAAHDAGLIHRDVKPENVLMADDGRVKVADFGLSRAINSDTQHTATGGVLIGTVSYLSPELVVNGKADARADVYAVGVLLFELLTGSKPHQADSPIQVAYLHVHEDIPAPSSRARGIPPYVDALVARATARDPDLRPADARVLLHQVRRVRNALDHGITDDADLMADLLPTSPILERTPTGELPAQIMDPEQAAEQVARRGRQVEDADGFYDQETDLDKGSITAPVARPMATAGGAPAVATLTARPSSQGGKSPATRPPAGRPPARPTARNGRSRRGPVLLVSLLVLALLVGLGGWYLGVGRYTSTPGVLNLQEQAAKTKVQSAGLTFRVRERDYSETVPEGAVLRTSPGPGDRVRKHGTVAAVVSRGPERHAVPDVRGLSLDQAQQRLDEAHLDFGSAVERFHETVPKDVVLGTDPKAGSPLRRDAAVDVVVSKGPRPIKIPDLTGKPAERANQRLTKLGFKVDSTTENSDTVPKGRVISQTPASGEGVKGDAIALVVSKGPALVRVPDVVRMGVAAATSALEGAGFKVKVEHTSLYIGVQYVVSSDPGGGSMVPRGSTVTIGIV